MANGTFTEPRFTDDNAAREHLESIRWPGGPVCPHCGGTERNSRLNGKSHRPGLLFCGDCREQFSVTVGTVFERSKVPLHKWVLATHLLCSSKKGMSSHQLHRTLGVTYKTAWFMSHRIREAMRPTVAPFYGQGGGSVEMDETFIGQKPGVPVQAGVEHKHKVRPIVLQNISHEARVLTDDSNLYHVVGIYFGGHETVNHSAKEYVRLSDRSVHTNTVEGFFSIFKRGMKGVYQHCGGQHLHRYIAEFDFRYSNRIKLGINDVQRTDLALKGISGKRLTYRRIGL